MIKKFIILISLLLFGCFNEKSINLSVKSCNVEFDKVQEQLSVLKAKDACLYLQIREDDIANNKLNLLLNAVKEQGIRFIAWPLLKEEQGPWANEDNYELVAKLLDKVTQYLEAKKIMPEYIVINMENSADQMEFIKKYLKEKQYREIIKLLLANIDEEKFNNSVRQYKKIVDKLHVKGYKVMVTTYPFMIDDFQDGDHDIQDMANVPINGIDWDAYTFTPYRTAYSGDFGVIFTPYIVYEYGRGAKEIFNDEARIAVGIIGDSEHGPGYTETGDIEKDVAAAKMAGIKELDLFHLGGMIKSGDVGSWINSDVEAKLPEIDAKVIAARVFVRSLDKILDNKYDENKIDEIMKILDSLKIERVKAE